jgi:integrase
VLSLSAVSDARIDRRMMWRARCSGARVRYSDLKEAARLRRTRVLCKFNGGKSGFENPARKLKGPKVSHRPTLPIAREEMVRILGALDPYFEQTAPWGRENARQLRSLVLVLRYSGMRIGNVVRLTIKQFNGNKLLLHTQSR